MKVTGSHVHFKSDSVFETVLDKDVEAGSDMSYGHLIAATVMNVGVCQGQSSIASLSCKFRALPPIHI